MKAMENEIGTLARVGAFIAAGREQWMSAISSAWALKRKRYPDGTARKLKARACARGFEQQEGIGYNEIGRAHV